MFFTLALGVTPLCFTDEASRLQHPDAHIDGFSLHAVLLAERGTDDTNGPIHAIHRRRLRFDDHPPRRRLDAAPFSATENSRDRVITLMKLNVAAYPGYLDAAALALASASEGGYPDRTWSQEVMDGILSEARHQCTPRPGPEDRGSGDS